MDITKYPQRKHPRIKHYDYSAPGYYFVTICTHQKRCIFGEPENLNRWGIAAQKGMKLICQHFFGVTVDKYVVMPNHVHAIIILDQATSTLSSVVGSYKSYISRQIHKDSPDLQVWQTSFHDHVIRNQHSYERIWSYIDTNPQRWENDCFYI